MRSNCNIVRSIIFRCVQISALTLFLLVSVLLVSGCQKEKGEIARQPRPTPTPCAVIDPPAFINQTSVARLGRRQECVPVGECVATLVDTEKKMAGNYCDQNYSTTCRPGFCSSGSCKPVYDSANSVSVHIRGCVAGAAGPPGCAAGEELCKCDLLVTASGELDCDCGCRN